METAIKAARARATTILEQHPKAIRGRFVDVEELARLAGIDVVKEHLKDATVSGFLQRTTKTGRPVIVVNESNADVRQRFTIAHELGHYFLHASQSVHVDDMDTADAVMYRDHVSALATRLVEIEANQFASELLMPERMISEDVTKLKEKNLGMSEVVERLAEQYDVSQAAMAIRLNRVKV